MKTVLFLIALSFSTLPAMAETSNRSVSVLMAAIPDNVGIDQIRSVSDSSCTKECKEVLEVSGTGYAPIWGAKSVADAAPEGSLVIRAQMGSDKSGNPVILKKTITSLNR